MDSGPENSDSFYIEGAPNNGPNPNDNFADDSDFGANYQQHSYRGGGPRGQMGMRGGGRPPYGGGGSNGPMNRPFGMQRCPPPGSYGPPRMPPGPRFQGGPSPRGMGGPRGPPPMMQGGYGDYQRPLRPPHFAPDANNGPDQMDGGWDMQGPPHHQHHQNGNPSYMGGGPQQPSGPPQNYGSGGPPQRNHHYNPNSHPPNYGPPGGGGAGFQQPPHGMQQQQPVQQPGLDLPNVAPGDEIWVETKAGDGKSYYYHAKTRETTWTRPEGPNVKVLTQQQVEAMAQQSAARPSEATMMPPQQANNYGSNAQQQPPYYPTHPGWNMGAPNGPPAVAPAVMVGPGPVPFPVMLGVDPGTDPALLSHAMEWCEYRSPEGKPYYFNVKSSSSVWEKPQVLKDYEVARLSAAARAHAGAMPAVQVVSESVATAEMVLAKKVLDDQTSKAADQLDTTKVEVKTEKEEIKMPKDKSRPVSSSPVTGTPWCVVWTGDGRVFFYNPSTRTSVWEKPDELKNRPDVDKLLSSTPGEKKDETIKDESRSASDKKKRSDSYAEEPPVKKSKSDDDAAAIDEPVVAKAEQPPVVKDTAMEAEVKAAQQRAIIPLEERVQQFKEMLAEKEVSAFSTWEKELHKIVFDSRYLLLTSKERKDVYEDFVRERVEEERREKRNRMKEKKDDFRNLMEDAKLSGKSTFSDFAHRYGKDERFRGVEKTRERESLFNEFIVEIRRKEKDDRDAQREKVRKEFENFLREQLGDQPSERYSRWTEVKRKLEDTKDSRLRNVDSSLREDYYRDWMRNVREKMEKKEKERESKNKESKSSKKDKERDRSRDRKDKDRSKDKDRKSHKDKSKSSKSKDKSSKDKSDKRRRDKSTSQGGEPEEGEMHDEAEENVHKEDSSKEGEERQVYQIDDDDDVKAVTLSPDGETKNDEEEGEGVTEDDDAAEEEMEKRQRERKAREEASLREREKEVQRALAPHLRDRDKERIAHQHSEAVLHFTALLTDLIRNPDISWKEAKRTLRKDSRSEVTEILQKEEKEKMFAEHIEKLSFKKRMRFREMLDEIGELTLNTAWKKVRSLIKDDPRYDKFSSSDRKCEKEFIEYMKDKMVAAKADFRELLKENKFISYKSMKSIRESDQALKDIETTLSKDRRYLQLDCVRQERTDLLMAHLEELERRGPPPPPTASEPTRRDKH